jgi:CBS domain-containing protein
MASFTVRDYMSARRMSFAPTMDVLEAIDLLVSENISGAPVIDDRGRLLGFFSEKDCMFLATQVGFHNERAGEVADHMTSPAVTVEADSSVFDIAKLFLEKTPRRYPVVEDNRLVGHISRRDVLRAMREFSAKS